MRLGLGGKGIICLIFVLLFFALGRGGADTFIIDRIEGNVAVIEWEGGHFHLPKELLAKNAKEGDILKITIEVDPQSTKDRLKKMEDLLEFDE